MGGRTTCVTDNGVSAVDYCITSISLFKKVIRLSVLDQTWYSDHIPLLLSLQVAEKQFTDDVHSNGMNLSPVVKFLWNDEYKEKYTHNMMDKQNQDKLNSFITHKYTDSNKAALDLTNIIRTEAESCIPLINISSEAKPKINKTELQNDNLLRSSKREFNKAKRRFKENRHNNERRKELVTTRRKYVK